MTITIKIRDIEKLVPMPASVTKLSQMAFDKEVNVADIARVIEYDQILTSNVLSWANSAWSAAQTTIVTVKDAVVRFGIDNILRLAIGKKIAPQMKNDHPGYELTANELWRHSVAATLAAECLGEVATKPVPRAAFTAALLHDIGKVLLGEYVKPEDIETMRHFMMEEELTYIEAEQKVLGTNHAIVGGEIARYWKFPEKFVSIIENHHVYEYPEDALTDTVQIANAVAKLLGIGLGSEQMHMSIDSKIPERMGIDDRKLELLCVKVAERLADTESMWEI